MTTERTVEATSETVRVRHDARSTLRGRIGKRLCRSSPHSWWVLLDGDDRWANRRLSFDDNELEAPSDAR